MTCKLSDAYLITIQTFLGPKWKNSEIVSHLSKTSILWAYVSDITWETQKLFELEMYSCGKYEQ